MGETEADREHDLWCAAFGATQEIVDDTDLKIEKMLLFQTVETPYPSIFHALSIELAYDLLRDSSTRQRLAEKYGFDALTFQEKTGSNRVLTGAMAPSDVVPISRASVLENARTRELAKRSNIVGRFGYVA
jgi:hypothetical protein